VHRNRILSRGYIRNVYCTQKQNTNQSTSEINICNVNINRIFSPRQKRNVYCAQKRDTFLAVHHKFFQCTETEHFPDGTSEICTLHRNRTFSSRYFTNVYFILKRNHSRRYIRNVYCAQKQNTFQTIHQKCVLWTEIQHIPCGI
jgi:hypothetical protein